MDPGAWRGLCLPPLYAGGTIKRSAVVTKTKQIQHNLPPIPFQGAHALVLVLQKPGMLESGIRERLNILQSIFMYLLMILIYSQTNISLM